MAIESPCPALRSSQRMHTRGPEGFVLTGQRLQLVPVRPAHLKAFSQGAATLSSVLDVEVPDGWPCFPQAFSGAHFDGHPSAEPPFEHYFFMLRNERVLVGNGGFKGAPDEYGGVEIGYEVAPRFRQKGFASEAAALLVGLAWHDERVTSVRAHTLAINPASQRVLRRVGMSPVAWDDDPALGVVVRWEIRGPCGASH